MVNQPSNLDSLRSKEPDPVKEIATILIVFVVLVLFICGIVYAIIKRDELVVVHKPVVVDLTIPNAKIADLEVAIQEKDVIIEQLTKAIKYLRENESSDIIDYVDVQYLDSTGIDNRAREIILLADSLRRAGHSWYEPIP
jgi:hypothetical protein